MFLSLLLTAVLAQPRCSADQDCVVTAFEGCCGACCQPEPYAMVREELERQQRRCPTLNCAGPDCSAVRCKSGESPSLFRAECRAGACVAVRRAEERRPPVRPSAECRVASDCTIVYPPAPETAACRASPCGCCPSTNPVAVSVEDPRARPTPERIPLTKEGDVQYGLTPGSTGMRRPTVAPERRPPPGPTCAACPPPLPARALCEEGRCVIAPHILRK